MDYLKFSGAARAQLLDQPCDLLVLVHPGLQRVVVLDLDVQDAVGQEHELGLQVLDVRELRASVSEQSHARAAV